MVDQLFGSKTRVKLLQLFYSNPNRAFYVREITRKIEEQINSVRRELSNLLSIGIITSDTTNNKLYYEVNQNYEFYKPLATIFGGLVEDESELTVGDLVEGEKPKLPKTKTPAQAAVSAQHPMAKALQQVGKVDLAFLSGQFTRDENAPVDMLIVGDVNQTKVSKYVSELEKTENKEIRYTVLTSKDYLYRMQVKDRFIYTILESKKQIIINDENIPLSFS